MADYDIGQVALLVVGAVVAWEGFYMVFKAVAVGGASFHPVFSGAVGTVVGLVMFVVGGLIAYGTYLEIGDEEEEAQRAPEPGGQSDGRGRAATRTANTTVGEDGGREPDRREGRSGQDARDPHRPERDGEPGERGDRPMGRDDRSDGTDDPTVTDRTEADDDFARSRDEGTEGQSPAEDEADPNDDEEFVEDFDLSDVERE